MYDGGDIPNVSAGEFISFGLTGLKKLPGLPLHDAVCQDRGGSTLSPFSSPPLSFCTLLSMLENPCVIAGDGVEVDREGIGSWPRDAVTVSLVETASSILSPLCVVVSSEVIGAGMKKLGLAAILGLAV